MSRRMDGIIANVAVETKTKKGTQNNDHSQSAAVDRSDESPRSFKLTIDCLNELLDYLTPKDLFALSQTC